jgi:glycosyltransferase involved in cell wall biosynthesis
LNATGPEEFQPNWTGISPTPELSTDRNLRIGLVISLFAPRESGAERQARLQAEELCRRGHQVTVYTRSLKHLPVEQLHMKHENGGRVLIRRVILTSSRGPLFGISYIWRLARALVADRTKLDIIHTHQALWESITTGLTRDFLKCPVIVQPASSGYDGEAQELMRTKGAWLLRRLAIRNRRFACISQNISEEWQSLGVPESAIFKAASGVDTKHFYPSPHQPPMSNPKHFQAIFTGRLHAQKQVDLLIKAWPQVLKTGPGRLLIVGDGPLREELISLRDSLGMTDQQVSFAGRLENTADALRESDIFVLPSRAEGMSNSLLEAMATGLPSVVSAIGGNVDLVDHESTGLLVRQDTPEAWAHAILQAFRNPEGARRWGQCARDQILRDYSIESVVDRNLIVYRRMIQNFSK